MAARAVTLISYPSMRADLVDRIAATDAGAGTGFGGRALDRGSRRPASHAPSAEDAERFFTEHANAPDWPGSTSMP